MLSLLLVPLSCLFRKLFEYVLVPFVDLVKVIFGHKNDYSKERKRFDFFDLYQTSNACKMGIIANDEEWRLSLPSQNHNEKLSVICLNSMGQSLRLGIDWKPHSSKTASIRVGFDYEDGKGNTYHMNEQNLIAFDKNKREYRAPGISFEVLSPFRRYRIKFRGFLTKNNSNELVFVKIRVLWIATSKVFDFECDHKKEFIDNELKTGVKSSEEIKFENRFEQMGQMKGTVQLEAQEEETLFLWGSQSKKYLESDQNRKITRLFGYCKKGMAFHIGQVNDTIKGVRFSYRYGFIFYGRTMISPIDALSDLDLSALEPNSTFSLKCSDRTLEVRLTDWSYGSNVWPILINGAEGRAVFSVEDEYEDRQTKDRHMKNDIYFPFDETTDALVLSLNDRRAENVLISGGKGSSLASMNYLKSKLSNSSSIEIPEGIVVTSNAYQLMLNKNNPIKNCIDKMKRVIGDPDSLKNGSIDVVNAFKSSQLPQEIKEQISKKLCLIYGENGFQDKSFAIRSSASGEDSEDMSAAGQMTTYLGIKGLDAIYSSVVKCWSSQFEFVAIEYKRGYGQDLNSLMAVVIQEMVDCDSAGVLFTCDPLTGSEREVIITGNYGIGESVVAAMAEPDTIRVAVDIKDNSFVNRKAVAIQSVVVGSKAKSIKLDGSGDGTVEVDRDETNQCCVNDENAMRLTNIALEVIPGCSSTCLVTFTFRGFMPMVIKDMHEREGLPLDVYCPYVPSDLITVYNHCFFNLKNSEFLRFSEGELSTYCKAMILSMFGHELDPEILKDCQEIVPKQSWKASFWKNFYISPYLIYPQHLVKVAEKQVHLDRYIFDDQFDTTRDMFDAMTAKFWKTIEPSMVHIKTSEASSLCNHFLIAILSEQKENPHIFTDFAFLLSQCGELVSADVPLELRQLAQTIKDGKQFREMSDERALQYLRSGSDKCCLLFKKFIEKHGHRGYKEFDPMTKVWKDDPMPVIKSIKTMLSGDASLYMSNAKKTVEQIIDSMQTPLSFRRKLLLKHIFLPLARRAVQMREWSKSVMVYNYDVIRQGINRLAQRMKSEGRIPDTELVFHMTPEELRELIDTRNPIIIWKAKQRQKLQKKMDSWKFDEIVSGYDFKPRELMENQFSNISADEVLKATPVSVGRIVARACVVPNLEDAVNIQPGDILITYSTDIGWSPYFPMISGIVTEIGGLISHGAVIAREYGLPCLVGANGACTIFKTGDTILLDCQKGVMCRVEDNNNLVENGKPNGTKS